MTIKPISDNLPNQRKRPAAQQPGEPQRIPEEPELPPQRTAPEIFPQKSPDINPQRTGTEIGPPPQQPEIYPQHSPDATPPPQPGRRPEQPR